MKSLKDRNCTKCGQFKTVAEFGPWRTQCRVCEAARGKAYQAARLKTDVNYRLRKNLRTRLYLALKRQQRHGSAVRDLGCSIELFKAYIATLFKPGMTWDNYGEWQIDHVKPLCAFDLTDPSQLRQALHFSNLQPLWARENQVKNGTF